MKTSTLSPLTRILLAALTALFFISVSAFAQQTKVYVGMRTSVCGSGLSASNALTAGVKVNRMEFEAGANMQTRHGHFSGLQMTTSYYILNDPTMKANLTAFINTSYNFSGYLSNSSIAREEMYARDAHTNLQDLTLKTFEMHAGLALKLQHTDHFSSFYAIGAGAYQTIGSKGVFAGMYREINSSSLYLSAGVRFSIN